MVFQGQFAERERHLTNLLETFPDYERVLRGTDPARLRWADHLRDRFPREFFADAATRRGTARAVLAGAVLLGEVERRFSNDARHPVYRFGTVEGGVGHDHVPMLNHHVGHTLDVVSGSVSYALGKGYDIGEVQDVAIGASGHDVAQGRRVTSELGSAALTSAVMERLGFPEYRAQRAFDNVTGTTFNEQTKRQIADPNVPGETAVACGDLYQICKRDGLVQAFGMLEKETPYLLAATQNRGLNLTSMSAENILEFLGDHEEGRRRVAKLWDGQVGFLDPKTGFRFLAPDFEEVVGSVRGENHAFIKPFPYLVRSGEKSPVELFHMTQEYAARDATPRVRDLVQRGRGRERTRLVYPQALTDPALAGMPPATSAARRKLTTLGFRPGRLYPRGRAAGGAGPARGGAALGTVREFSVLPPFASWSGRGALREGRDGR